EPASSPTVYRIASSPDSRAPDNGRQPLSSVVSTPVQDKPSTETPSETAPAKPAEKEGNESVSEYKEPKSGEGPFAEWLKPRQEYGGFCSRLYKAYYDEFFPSKKETGEEEPEKPRRALPSPWDAPPFPNSEYQGYPLIGVPAPDPGQYP